MSNENYGLKIAKAIYETNKDKVMVAPKSIKKNSKLSIPIEALHQFRPLVDYATTERTQESIDDFKIAFKKK